VASCGLKVAGSFAFVAPAGSESGSIAVDLAAVDLAAQEYSGQP